MQEVFSKQGLYTKMASVVSIIRKFRIFAIGNSQTTGINGKKASEKPAAGSVESRLAELEAENRRLKAALEYSELRVEAFSMAIDYYNKQEGVDILKKAGTRQL